MSEQGRAVRHEALEAMVLLLNPVTPHVSHALWQVLGHPRDAARGSAVAAGRSRRAGARHADAGGAGQRQVARHHRGAPPTRSKERSRGAGARATASGAIPGRPDACARSIVVPGQDRQHRRRMKSMSRMQAGRPFQAALLLATTFALAACGFHLRANAALPPQMQRVHLTVNGGGDLERRSGACTGNIRRDSRGRKRCRHRRTARAGGCIRHRYVERRRLCRASPSMRCATTCSSTWPMPPDRYWCRSSASTCRANTATTPATRSATPRRWRRSSAASTTTWCRRSCSACRPPASMSWPHRRRLPARTDAAQSGPVAEGVGG